MKLDVILISAKSQLWLQLYEAYIIGCNASSHYFISHSIEISVNIQFGDYFNEN